MKPWVAYSLIRIGIFAAVFVILMLADVPWWLAAVIAAVVGLTVSYIFFSRLRDAVARDLAERRTRPAADADAVAEDR